MVEFSIRIDGRRCVVVVVPVPIVPEHDMGRCVSVVQKHKGVLALLLCNGRSAAGIKDVEILDGGMRLENVTLVAHGKITINHPTTWEESTITHNSSSNEDNILLQSQLTIKGTNLTINAPEGVWTGSGIEGIELGDDSKLIITDKKCEYLNCFSFF